MKQRNYLGILPKSWQKRENQFKALANVWFFPWTIHGTPGS